MAEKSPSKSSDGVKTGWQGKQAARNAPAASAPKPSGGRPGSSQPQVMFSPSGKELRGIVRLAGRDLRGNLPLRRALWSIKGIGLNLAKIMADISVTELKIDPSTMIGELEEEQIDKLEQVLLHPEAHGVPAFMLNRPREPMGGETRHLIGADLTYAVKNDIEHEKDSYTWRGYRHAYGQKVRGQHTRSTGRSGMTVGVMRKAIMAKAGAVTTGAAAQAAGAPAPAAGGKDRGAAPKGGAAPAAAAPKAGAAAPKAAAPAAKAPAGKPAEKK